MMAISCENGLKSMFLVENPKEENHFVPCGILRINEYYIL